MIAIVSSSTFLTYLVRPKSFNSSSESESESDSDSEADVADDRNDKKDILIRDLDDDEESGPVAAAATYFQTKNEIAEVAISTPDIEEVGPDERLEKVGEVMNIVDNLAIIKGVQSESATRGSERALDSDTLLVFEDRKVMGYVSHSLSALTEVLICLPLIRSTKPLDQLHNPSIRSSTTNPILSIHPKSKYPVRYFTSQKEVNLCL